MDNLTEDVVRAQPDGNRLAVIGAVTGLGAGAAAGHASVREA